jgi:hypothetical protein
VKIAEQSPSCKTTKKQEKATGQYQATTKNAIVPNAPHVTVTREETAQSH